MRFFEAGAHKEGYWTYDHMALQMEDLVDCLTVLYPDHDIYCLYDQSSGHGRKRVGGLNAKDMNRKYGGDQPVMRNTKITDGCLGPHDHPGKLKAGDEQKMVSKENDEGPFWLNPDERISKKYDTFTGQTKSKEKSVSELIAELQSKNVPLQKRSYRSDETKELAQRHGIDIQKQVRTKTEGWVGKPKGLLQVLWERGWIDPSKPLESYTVNGKKDHFDSKGNLKADFEAFALKNLMGKCEDFRTETSAMEQLAADLSNQNMTVSIMTSPKYHCEIAGEGIEYAWGMAKKYYRSLKLEQKKGKNTFKESVLESLKTVKVEQTRQFSGRARRYMIAYQHYAKAIKEKGEKPTYPMIEKFMKQCKTHRNAADQVTGWISKVLKEALMGGVAE